MNASICSQGINEDQPRRRGTAMPENLLFYGDNLDVLRGRFQDGRPYIADESVDLIYLDPPFNSNADYNAFFAEQDGSRAAAQIKAFEDTWEWNQASARAYHQFIEDAEVPDRARRAMIAFRDLLGDSNMLAYLAMMAPRLVELRKKLKPTGSLYLHCDPTASHYLKVLLDGVFGAEGFRNEIIWKRHNARSSDQRWPRVHDIILFYAKAKPLFKLEYVAGEKAKLPHTLITGTDGLKYQTFELTAAGTRNGETGQAWRGFNPTDMGRHWGNLPTKLDEWDAAGLIHWPKGGGFPRRRAEQPFDENRLVAVGDVWTDIDRINQAAKERLGYPTQKPVALLERIIQASANEGDTVLDPFCGCGTTIAAAQKLNRRWIGIDVTSLATTLIKSRLNDQYGPEIAKTYRVIGEPTTVQDAERLAASDPYQFQWWALGLVGARPVEQKKGGDKGIDGRLYFHDDASAASKQAIFSVKAGQSLNPGMVRDLGHVVGREKAAIGVLLTMREPTAGMRTEAAGAGFYRSPGWHKDYPRLQIISVADLLAGKQVDLPPSGDFRTFKKSPKIAKPGPTTPKFFDDAEAD
jgi:site-specific DNA-methyltransferase (adenine-specific)